MQRFDNTFEVNLWTTMEKFLKFRSRHYVLDHKDIGFFLSKYPFIDVILLPVAGGLRGSRSSTVSLWINVYIKSPEVTLPAKYFIYVFNYKLWLAIFVCIILIILFLYLLKSLLKLKLSHYMELIFLVFGISNSTFTFNSIAYNICHVTTNLMNFIVMASFSAFLIAQLSIVENNLPFETISDIFHQTDYAFCIHYRTHPFKVLLKSFGNSSGILNSNKCPTFSQKNYSPVLMKSICEHPKSAFGFYNYRLERELQKYYNKYVFSLFCL